MQSVGAVIQSEMNGRPALRIAIRADASAEIGTGHIRRCQSLATTLRNRGAEVRFVCRDFGFDYEPILGEQPSILATPPGIVTNEDNAPTHARWLGVTQLHDSNDFVATLNQWSPDWVLVDSYAIDARWHGAVRAAVGCRIAVIDDLADRQLDTDLLIDHNWHKDHRAKYSGWLDRQPMLATGPAYALIDQKYASAMRYQFKNEVRSIGIFMGGTDANNASGMAFEAVIKSNFQGYIEIVTMASNPHLGDLQSLAKSRSKTYITLDLPNLAAFFSRHDLQIGAGGGATWERFCIGAPTIAVATANNQRDVLTDLVRCGFQWGLSRIDLDLLSKVIREALDNPSQRLRQMMRGLALIDGLGTNRVAEFFQLSNLKGQ